jgi:anaerobic magnesium-protoporphyrin IX monomethyl ester cyclase
MKRAGFEFIELGVESGDAQVLSRSRKGARLEEVESAARLAAGAGLKVWLKFILGLPGESMQSIRRSIALAVRLNPSRLSVALIVPYPGSQIYEWARKSEHGYRLTSRDWSDFDKYTGSCLRVEGLPPWKLKWMQARMYLETLLRNGRGGDLARMVLQNGALIRSFTGSFLRRPSGP